MRLDPRIPLLYDYYKVIYNGVIVNNLSLKDKVNYNNPTLDLVQMGRDNKINYFTFLEKDLNTVSDCINISDRYIHGRLYRYLETANYTVLLDFNNVMVTDEITYGVELFDSGGYIAIPYNKIKVYDTTVYRLFGYIDKYGKKLKTYSIIKRLDFKYIGKYSMEDVIAYVMTKNTDYVEGYIVESKGEGIVDSNIIYNHDTTTGLVYQGELEKIVRQRRLNGKYIDYITNEQLSEFVKQRSIRIKLDNNATHAIISNCKY